MCGFLLSARKGAQRDNFGFGGVHNCSPCPEIPAPQRSISTRPEEPGGGMVGGEAK